MRKTFSRCWGILGIIPVLLYSAGLLYGESYNDWKASVFSAQEQADPNISGENANPAGDGISNLLKFAFDLDPHKAATS